jgi:hypothetical protein
MFENFSIPVDPENYNDLLGGHEFSDEFKQFMEDVEKKFQSHWEAINDNRSMKCITAIDGTITNLYPIQKGLI